MEAITQAEIDMPGFDPRQSLLKAFETFQRQCETLEATHLELQGRLRSSEVELARKNAELAAKMSEVEAVTERLKTIVASIADAVFLVKNGAVEMRNNAAERLMSDGFNLDDQAVCGEVAALLAAGIPVRDVDLALRLNGEDRAFMVSVAPLAEGGVAEGVVLTMKDVTEHRRLQTRVASEERLAAVGRVAASVAHEIRNPLSGIEGFATLLVRDLKDSPAQLRLAERTVASSRRLSQVVTSLLNYTREFKCSLSSHDLNALATETVELVKPHAGGRAELRLSLCEGPLHASLDKTLLSQVLSNLLLNAVDACPDEGGGVIELSTRRMGRQAVISVSDNGCGIPPQALRRLFEPFFTTKVGGVGLGLALCERIVKAHGGQIEADSVEGQGATFTLKLSVA